MASLTLEVRRQVPFRVSLATAKRLGSSIVRRYLPREAKRGVGLSLAFISDPSIRKINQKHRGKDAATDVLSFSFLPISRGHAGDSPMIGELFISVPTLRKQAKAHGNTAAKEFEVLFVHGFLHILGYDHETTSDLEIMVKEERRWLGDNAGLIDRSRAESKKGSRSNQRKP